MILLGNTIHEDMKVENFGQRANGNVVVFDLECLSPAPENVNAKRARARSYFTEIYDSVLHVPDFDVLYDSVAI